MITLRVTGPDTALFRLAAALAGQSINAWARDVLRERARDQVHQFAEEQAHNHE